MYSIRMFFEKKDSARYISHLDLMRCFERCIRRSGIPIWYTEGFNPRPFLTFALPLSLGTSGLGEVVDLRLTELLPFDEVARRINACLPVGLRIIEVSEPVKKNTAIAASRYEITLLPQSMSSVELCTRLCEFLARESITVTKLNKKKQPVESDLKRFIKACEASENGELVTLRITLSSGCTENCNPSLVLDAFTSQCDTLLSEYAITRTAILDVDGELFR